MLRKDRKTTKKREGHREKTVHDSVSHAKDLNKGKTISRNQIELKNIKPINLSSNIITTVEAVLASLIWLFVAYKLFEVKTLWSNIVLALTYFICCTIATQIIIYIFNSIGMGSIDPTKHIISIIFWIINYFLHNISF